jgi:hypothetical protein
MYYEARTCASNVFHFDVPAMKFNDRFADGKTKT